MRCKSCEYPLWNLRTRACPECGGAFKPSEFSFVPNSVCFCCPHCSQTYYGTGENGHLVPPAFTCVKCGVPVHMDEMVLLPAGGLAEERTRVAVVPWLDRSRKTFTGRWIGTLWMSLFSPARLARAIPASGAAGRSLLYAVVTLSLYFATGLGVVFLAPLLLGAMMARRGGVGFSAILGMWWLVLVPILAAAAVLAWTTATAVLLRLTGPKEGGWSRTLMCISLSSGACVLLAIPCLAIYASVVCWIWWAIVAAVLVSVSQKVGGLRAAIAVIAPPLLMVTILISLLIYGFSTAMTAISSVNVGAGVGGTSARGPAMVASATAGLDRYVRKNGGPPPHALALLTTNEITLVDCYDAGFPLQPGSGLFAGTNVLDMLTASDAERRRSVDRAAAAAGSAPAHRLGDLVFTYPGLDLQAQPTPVTAPLWTVVHIPLKAAAGSSPAPSSGPYVAGRRDGTSDTISRKDWPAALTAQNAAREAAGLSPLPDLELLP